MRVPLALFGAVLTASLTSFTTSARAGERLAGPVQAEVVRVIDGDTLVVRARIWLGQSVETHVRLAGIDAPELRGKCEREKMEARAAREALAALVATGPVALSAIKAGKFGGRVIARVGTASHEDAASALIAGGHVRAYEGGARAGWCGLAGPPPHGAPRRLADQNRK
ncbi:MAG: nuclease [Alphaproteobacteria bacterium HGW-Alphaproteobacteria-12]|nr:MAG: nuclease [Alphaproteobacteria bacterium HGW-Alphaproteobacteria-12]